jgi:hypothetical protein
VPEWLVLLNSCREWFFTVRVLFPPTKLANDHCLCSGMPSNRAVLVAYGTCSRASTTTPSWRLGSFLCGGRGGGRGGMLSSSFCPSTTNDCKAFIPCRACNSIPACSPLPEQLTGLCRSLPSRNTPGHKMSNKKGYEI